MDWRVTYLDQRRYSLLHHMGLGTILLRFHWEKLGEGVGRPTHRPLCKLSDSIIHAGAEVRDESDLPS
jgi:hypothetical protein